MITFFSVLSSGDTSIALGPNESATFIRTNIAPTTTVTAVLSVKLECFKNKKYSYKKN